jgi:hypothetical protein
MWGRVRDQSIAAAIPDMGMWAMFKTQRDEAAPAEEKSAEEKPAKEKKAEDKPSYFPFLPKLSMATEMRRMADSQRELEMQIKMLRAELAPIAMQQRSVGGELSTNGKLFGTAQAAWELQGKFCCFLSHFKREAATEARMLQQVLTDDLQCPVFIDSDDLKDLNRLQQHVRESDVLVLLLTTSFLTRPWHVVHAPTLHDRLLARTHSPSCRCWLRISDRRDTAASSLT